MRPLRVAAGIALLLGAGLAGVAAIRLLEIHDTPDPPFGELRAAALGEPVEVIRDRLGVPHVWARNEADAFFGLGLVHAQDRLWQMELLRRTARGTLAEIFGAPAVPADRLARTLGFARAADREVAGLSDSTRRLLEAYASGVNRWLREVAAARATRPFELARLGLEPSPWKPADSLALLRLRAWLLGRSLDASVLLQRLVQEVGGVAAQPFFPVRPGAREHLTRLAPALRAARQLARAAGLRGTVGSTGFIVGSRHSQSGLPILANDTHVELRTPASFYLAQLRTRDWEVAGATWPGIPVFWSATNGRIAWGQVALYASTLDLYEETLRTGPPELYDVAGRWRPLAVRREILHVRGGADLALQVRSTRHGPLLGSLDPNAPDLRTLALRWIGETRRSGIAVFLSLQHARSWGEFRESLQRLEAPATTFLYADATGRGGLQVAGRLPIRSVPTGLLPVPGRSRYYDWRGFIPFDALPRRLAEAGEDLIALPRPRTGEFPHPVSWIWYPGISADFLQARLDRVPSLDLEAVLAIQRDLHSARGPGRVRAWLQSVRPRSRGGAQLREWLLAWDGATDSQSLGAAAYYAFRDRLLRTLLGSRLSPELLGSLLELGDPLPGALAEHFVGDLDPEEVRALAAEALDRTWSWLSVTVSSNPERWTWGALHPLRLEHAFEIFGSRPLRWLGRRASIGPRPAPGSADSLWAMFSAAGSSLRPRVGPGLRIAVDLAEPRHPWVGLAGGESGRPRSPHYSDAFEDWIRGRARPLWMGRASVVYHAEGVWRLEPSP
ncbi:MAG: penicillin acylase family protein [Myxococcota bacterium]